MSGVMTLGSVSAGWPMAADSEVRGVTSRWIRCREAFGSGIFIPLPWPASANPLEPLRGPWQLHVRNPKIRALSPKLRTSGAARSVTFGSRGGEARLFGVGVRAI